MELLEKIKQFPLMIFSRTLIALILFQSAYFKFVEDSQSIHIFTTIGIEPYGRLTIGIIELLIGIYLLTRYWKKAAMLSFLFSIVSIYFHAATKLGIIIKWNNNSDGGILFGLLIIVLVLRLF